MFTDGATKCTGRELRQDRARAAHLLIGRVRVADENPAATWRIPGPGWIQRAVDSEARHAGAAGQLGEQIVNAAGIGAADDGDADRLRSGRNLEPDGAAGIAPQHSHPLPVQRDLDRVVGADGWQPEEPAAGAAHSELVLGVQREDVLHDDAAAGAQRQPFTMLGLRHPARCQIGREVGADRRVADCEAADLRCCRHVRLHQRWRDAEHARQVVEALARIVAGKQGGGVDRQVEQIPHRVAVLGAVQAMERRRTRIGSGGGCPIDGVLNGLREAIERRAVGSRRAARRHHAGAHLAHDLLPGLRLPPGVGDLHRLERETAGAHPPVVARDAVAVDHALARRSLGGGGLRGWRGGRRRRLGGL